MGLPGYVEGEREEVCESVVVGKDGGRTMRADLINRKSCVGYRCVTYNFRPTRPSQMQIEEKRSIEKWGLMLFFCL